MIANFESVCPAYLRMKREMEYMNHIAEGILSALEEVYPNGMRAWDITTHFGQEHTCQKIVAILRKLMMLGVVERIEVGEGKTSIQRLQNGQWIPKEISFKQVEFRIRKEG